MSKRPLEEELAEIDAVAAAEKIMVNPLRGAMAAPSLAVVAMANRLLALEELAGAVHRLLFLFDTLAAVRATSQDAVTVGTHALLSEVKTSIETITEQISGALLALGYAPQPEDTHGQEGEGAGH